MSADEGIVGGLADAERLRALAAQHGVDTEYWDWQGHHQQVALDSLAGVLAAFGADGTAGVDCATGTGPLLPPCLVTRAGHPQPLSTAVTAARVTLEDGTSITLGDVAELPGDLPTGYHRLSADVDGATQHCELVVTPDRLTPPDPHDPKWGFAVQLYSVRSAGSWGIGDFADLASLAEWSARDHGADFVLVNPVHAAEVVAPMNPSPYLPTSRRFANPVYLRVEDVAEFAQLSETDRVAIGQLRDHARAVAELIDRDRSWAAKRAALERVFALGLSNERATEFNAFRSHAGNDLARFATWCVLCELHGNDWRNWPAELQDPASPAVEATAPIERVDFYAWLQWLLEQQLADAQRRALAAGMRIGIIHDLAVGVSPAGADAWSWQQVVATEVTVGAPPDAYSQKGQDWQQPPWRPDKLAEICYAPVRDLFRAALRHGGGIRVDHIIGLFRLWWIPAAADARAGTYVHYDADALIGILALEAQRAGGVIIGEDLGNVEPRVRGYLHERGLLGTSILWFEFDYGNGVPLPPQLWRSDCLASVTTHDLPPSAGYLEGEHIRLREQLGLLTRAVADEYAEAAKEREAWLAELRRLGLLSADAPSVDDIVQALHAFLTLTPSSLRCVALTDAVGERRTQNQPGTSDEHPNWRIPLGGPDGAPVFLEELTDDPRVTAVINAVRQRPAG